MLITKKSPGFTFFRIGVFGFGVVLFAIASFSAVSAITSISQGYTASKKISQGSIVSLENDSTDHIIAATNKNVNNILGVTINSGSSLITLTNGENQVQVATSGMANVLISDINGVVAQGDQITASPIAGVGMKATNNTKVVGIAQGDPISQGSYTQTYTLDNGVKQDITLTQVPILVNVTYYYKQPEKTIIPQALQDLANAIAGKTVDTLPIIISAGIFIITLIVVVSIIYSMIKSSIISVGRNPMSQSAVYRDVIQLSALVLGILSVALISIYVILTRL
jgi:hypothetical protein